MRKSSSRKPSRQQHSPEAGAPRHLAPPAAPTREAVADALHSAAVHLLRRVRREDVHTGLAPAQASALSVLVFAGPRTLTDLARIEQVRPPTMSRVVAELKRKRLVRRIPDRLDARAAILEPTAKGARLLQAGRRRRVEALAALLQAQSDSDLRTLESAARLIESVLHPVRGNVR